jgi:hypothetical protein
MVSAVLAERSPLSAQSAQSGATRQAAAAPAAQAPTRSTMPAPMRSAAGAPDQDHNAVIKKYCAGCHTDRRPAAGLSLASFDVAGAVEHAEVTEKMIVKLQAGMMPPARSVLTQPPTPRSSRCSRPRSTPQPPGRPTRDVARSSA